MKYLNFLWWNLENCAQFDSIRSNISRWPDSPEAYEEKLRRVYMAIKEIEDSYGNFGIMAFGEITSKAADDLAAIYFPGYKVFSFDPYNTGSSFHVAVLYKDNLDVSIQAPLVVPYQSRANRPMGVFEYESENFSIRFIAVHWPPPFGDESKLAQEESARFLQKHLYSYLTSSTSSKVRHAVVLGDFNCEPFGYMHTHLQATRSRLRAAAVPHFQDVEKNRVRLYNCSWRLLGEQHPHPATVNTNSPAGSYYLHNKKEWMTVDQILVSGGMLNQEVPYLKEENVRILSPEGSLADDGTPAKFVWCNGSATGISDHLPVMAQIIVG